MSNTKNVKFISYSGSYPNLCNGVLTLLIDGQLVHFGHDYSKGNWQNDGNYDSFWCSGGTIDFDTNTVEEGEWNTFRDQLPKIYQDLAWEIDEVINANMPHGCCGGCA